ncbi:MAG: histidine phosphatase family protein [Elusimicrobia bacterium]|nr:histidine phosphatase family protein [Elusimicrobiota bacterium]
MIIYVMRHGHSPSVTEAGVLSDAERPLSDRGKADVRRMVRQLLEKGGSPSAVFTSPLTRAMETAAVAAEVLRLKDPPRVYAPLSNQISGAELFLAFRKDFKGAQALIVGHQPQVGDMISAVTAKRVDFKPAGIAAIDAKGASQAGLLWSINP